MDRLRVAIIFGGCSEEHAISVKSAQEVAKVLDREKYEPFYVGITKSGAWKLCDVPKPNWENDNCRPAALSPDRSEHGLLVLEQGKYEMISLDIVLPVLHGKLGEDGAMQGLLELSGIPYVGCDVQSSALCMDKSLAYIVARHAGIATPDVLHCRAERQDRSRPPYVSRLRKASPLGVIFRCQQSVRERGTPECGGICKTVRLESVDRRGCSRQRGGMRDIRERHGFERRRARSHFPIAWVFQNPSGGSA